MQTTRFTRGFDLVSERTFHGKAAAKEVGVRPIPDWWRKDPPSIPKIHPTQKPVVLLKQLISIFTDPGDVVIDPCAGSGSTLRVAKELRQESYGFEVSRPLYQRAVREMLDFQNNQLCFLDFMEGA